MSDTSDEIPLVANAGNDTGNLGTLSNGCQSDSKDNEVIAVLAIPPEDGDICRTGTKTSKEEELKEVLQDLRKGSDVQIKRLLEGNRDLINHRYEHNRTPLHLLCRRFAFVKDDEDTEPFIVAAQALLSADADVNIADSIGSTVLHVAAEQKIPADILKDIIQKTNDVNRSNYPGEAPIHKLFQTVSKSRLTPDHLEVFIAADADLELKEKPGLDELSALQYMAMRTDCLSLMPVVDSLKPQLLTKHAPSMLRSAVRRGTSHTVKELLLRGVSESDGDERPLIFDALYAKTESVEKLHLLLENRHNININAVDGKGETILHKAAFVDNADVMKKALDKKVDLQQASKKGELPIHRCVHRNGSKCLKLLVEAGSQFQLDAETNDRRSPLYIAAQYNAKDNIALLVQAGCSGGSKMREFLAFENIKALIDQEVILQSPTPVKFAVEITSSLKKRADTDESHQQDLLEMAKKVEQLAIALVDGSLKEEAYSILDDDLISYALDNNLKKFIATARVEEHLRVSWYGQDKGGAGRYIRKREYVTKVSKYLMKMFLLPFFMIIMLPQYSCNYTQFAHEFLERDVEPVIVFIANSISYAVFLACLIINVILNNEVSRCENLVEGIGCGLSALDWVVFLFVLGLIVQEATQLNNIKFTQYCSSVTNILELILISLFVVYYSLAVIGFYSHVDINYRYQLVRASYHVLGFAALISCIRFLSFLQVHSVLGPIQVSFADILADVLMFLVILGTFLVGFAVSVTSIYSARTNSPGKPANATAPYHVDNFWMSLKTMFWAVFGFADDTVFKTGSDVDNSAEVVVGTALYAVWCVIAIIVLLNMLIALINDSFQNVQNNANIEWKFARAWIIRDIKKAMPFPIPVNIIHVLAQMVPHLCRSTREGTDKPDGAVRNLFRNLIRLDSSLLPPDVANKRIANRYKKSLKVGKEELDGRLSNDTWSPRKHGILGDQSVTREDADSEGRVDFHGAMSSLPLTRKDTGASTSAGYVGETLWQGSNTETEGINRMLTELLSKVDGIGTRLNALESKLRQQTDSN